MTAADPTIASLGLEPTYSAREAAVLLGRSYSWLDQRLRKNQFIRTDGTPVRPLRTPGGYRRFTTEMLKDIATSSYRQHWFSMDHLKSTYRELLVAAHRVTGEHKIRVERLLMAARGRGQRSLASQPERLIARSGMGDLSQGPRTIKAGARVVPSRRANQYVRLASGLSQKRYRDDRFGCAGARPVIWVKVSLIRLTISSGTLPSLRGSRRTRPPRSKL